MGSFTNHRLINKNIFTILESNEQLPGMDSFYQDIYRCNISVGGVPCLSRSKVLINGISKEVIEEDNQAVRSSKALFEYIFQKYTVSPLKQPYYENFIKLFLNQLYFGIPTMTCSGLLIEKEINSNLTFNLDINLNSDNLYLTVSYLFKEAENKNHIILNGKTTFKIESHPLSKGNLGFIAKFSVVDSTIGCNNKYKHILDTRVFLEKIVDFITSIIEKITNEVDSDTFLKSNLSLKSKPIFFISKDGKSLDDKLINPPKKLLKEMTR